MFPAALPFDYLKHFDRGDRIRRLRTRPTGIRVRRGTPRDIGDGLA